MSRLRLLHQLKSQDVVSQFLFDTLSEKAFFVATDTQTKKTSFNLFDTEKKHVLSEPIDGLLGKQSVVQKALSLFSLFSAEDTLEITVCAVCMYNGCHMFVAGDSRGRQYSWIVESKSNETMSLSTFKNHDASIRFVACLRDTNYHVSLCANNRLVKFQNNIALQIYDIPLPGISSICFGDTHEKLLLSYGKDVCVFWVKSGEMHRVKYYSQSVEKLLRFDLPLESFLCMFNADSICRFYNLHRREPCMMTKITGSMETVFCNFHKEQNIQSVCVALDKYLCAVVKSGKRTRTITFMYNRLLKSTQGGFFKNPLSVCLFVDNEIISCTLDRWTDISNVNFNEKFCRLVFHLLMLMCFNPIHNTLAASGKHTNIKCCMNMFLCIIEVLQLRFDK